MYGANGISDTDTTSIMEYPFAYGNRWGLDAGAAMVNPAYPGPAVAGDITQTFTSKKRYAAFYSGDLRLSVTGILPKANDKILNFGQDIPDVLTNINDNGLTRTELSYAKYRWTSGRSLANPFVQENVLEGAAMVKNTIVKMNSGADTVTKRIKRRTVFTGIEIFYDSWRDYGLMVRLSADISQPNGAAPSDYGFYNALYYRAAVNQYGNPENNKIIPTNCFIDISTYKTNIIPKGSLHVYGGDTFTQVCFKKPILQT
jgi:hypothetical protein